MDKVSDVAGLGRALRRARKEQGLSQAELAAIAGVGVRFVSELERGKPTVELGLVLRVLRDAGVDLFVARRGAS